MTKILLTGGFGFIGSTLAAYFQHKYGENYQVDIIDSPNCWEKWGNLNGLTNFRVLTEPLFGSSYDFVILLGAKSSTSIYAHENNFDNNVSSIERLLGRVVYKKLIFASSASVYGNSGSFNENDTYLKQTNFYGWTKKKAEELVSERNGFCLRFFNVYGKNEKFKEKNSQSPVYSFLNTKEEEVKIFKSDNAEINTEEMGRDFIFVQDVCEIIDYILNNDCQSGVYNVGTGIKTSWTDIARYCGKKVKFIDMPANFSGKYQYQTCANITKLRNVLGYKKEFTPMSAAISFCH